MQCYLTSRQWAPLTTWSRLSRRPAMPGTERRIVCDIRHSGSRPVPWVEWWWYTGCSGTRNFLRPWWEYLRCLKDVDWKDWGITRANTKYYRRDWTCVDYILYVERVSYPADPLANVINEQRRWLFWGSSATNRMSGTKYRALVISPRNSRISVNVRARVTASLTSFLDERPPDTRRTHTYIYFHLRFLHLEQLSEHLKWRTKKKGWRKHAVILVGAVI